MNPDVVAAVCVPAMMAFLGAICFRSIREGLAARLRGRSTDEIDSIILAEIRSLRTEVYALRSEVAAIPRPPVAPALGAPAMGQRAPE